MKNIKESIKFYGHPNITGLHKTTIEVTRDKYLTKNGDCIIGISANKGCIDLADEFITKLKMSNTKLKILLLVNNKKFLITAKGSLDLHLTHSNDIVIRKSNFLCSRTLAINSNKSAFDIPRDIIEDLQNTNTIGILELTISD